MSDTKNDPDTTRALRADAARNEDAVLQAAKEVFLQSGVDAPVREVAKRAGVGVGTLYRRFPKRSDLIKAVFRREIDTCADAARGLEASLDPGDAVAEWLMLYAGFMGTKKGLAVALHSGDDAYADLPVYFRERFEPALACLLERAEAANLIRTPVQPYDLLRAIGNLSMAEGEDRDAHVKHMVSLIIQGLLVR
ncbi:transcriptional regulator, TetR family [Aliiroseovarius halocynthiae]|uniref:TetR/AcrR family transcriptional regulator n=1 Tax=Aliiroseovarius halocynthiae TaxID=985055 RepID=A0A545SV63_9RHOB|nr:TetR/AcrR family transcriptional regulator [Aliiroseovarius halocynthiae]TQV68862.1 TetR/AcrR family transcriptional regulator [Aliiroseovarius halocynthiae]SMR71295.1 transcriptional regulator, TetR family [Aliiroseovarius halocynthiae]